MKILLAPLELVWRGLNRARRALYRWGVLDGKRLPRPVISIGNIAAGGTGKTPAVIEVCRFLESRGLRVAVLTRGFGRPDPSSSGIITELDARQFGDEPVLIRRRIKGDVLVSGNRYQIAQQYLSDHDCDVFVLDDGFQHLQLQRDLDIVVDAPARFHREGRAALRHADIVIPRRLRPVVPDLLRATPVFAFAGLANNEQFFESLRVAGLDLAGTRSFSDHHRYRETDLEAIRRDARGAPIVTTEKDAVKIADPSIVAIPAEFEIESAVLERVVAVATDPDKRKRKRRKSLFVQRVEYLTYRIASRLVGSMSEESLVRWGTRLGMLARHLLARRDRLAMRNLESAFPERSAHDRRGILDDCWRHFGREVLQVLQFRNLPASELSVRCPISNAHLIDESIARGKGTVYISAHWGGWEIGGQALAAYVPDLRGVARPLDNELLEADLQRLRSQTGAVVVNRRRAARALMRGLAENAVVVLLPDQAVLPREGVLVPFLGHDAWTTDAPAKLVLRAGSTIVFGFCIPDGPRHRLELEEPIRADLLTEQERDPVALTRRINDVISNRIRERPELWLWMHDRWKGTA